MAVNFKPYSCLHNSKGEEILDVDTLDGIWLIKIKVIRHVTSSEFLQLLKSYFFSF